MGSKQARRLKVDNSDLWFIGEKRSIAKTICAYCHPMEVLLATGILYFD